MMQEYYLLLGMYYIEEVQLLSGAMYCFTLSLQTTFFFFFFFFIWAQLFKANDVVS